MYNVLSGLPCCWWWKSVVCMTAFSECRQFSVLSFENFTFWSRSWRKLVDLQLKPIVHCQKLFPQEPAAADTTSQPELKQTKSLETTHCRHQPITITKSATLRQNFLLTVWLRLSCDVGQPADPLQLNCCCCCSLCTLFPNSPKTIL